MAKVLNSVQSTSRPRRWWANRSVLSISTRPTVSSRAMRKPATTSTRTATATSLSLMLVDVKFVDVNGDGVIDDADKVECGSGIPKLEVNLNFNVAWKGFDLSGVIGSAWGHKLYNGNMYFYESMNAGSNFLTSTLMPDTDQYQHRRAACYLQRPQRQPQGERPLPEERQFRASSSDSGSATLFQPTSHARHLSRT